MDTTRALHHQTSYNTLLQYCTVVSKWITVVRNDPPLASHSQETKTTVPASPSPHLRYYIMHFLPSFLPTDGSMDHYCSERLNPDGAHTRSCSANHSRYINFQFH